MSPLNVNAGRDSFGDNPGTNCPPTTAASCIRTKAVQNMNNTKRMQNIIVTTSDELRGLIGEAVRSALAEAAPHQQPVSSELEEKLVNEHELRRVLGLSHPTIVRLRKEGLLPYLRLGRRVMYSLAEVRTAMERQAFRGGRK